MSRLKAIPLVFALLLGLPIASEARSILCGCMYLQRPDSANMWWEFHDFIEFDGDKSSFEPKGIEACRREVKTNLLDQRYWDGKSVRLNGCRYWP